jgi:hypothetical protein
MGHKMLYLARRNPVATAAEFPKLWRSHAAFVSQFGAVGSRFTQVMQCSRVLDAPGVAGTSQDYDGVAVLSCPTLEDTHTQGLPPDIRVKVDADERRVFDGLVEDFTMRAKEHVLLDTGFDAARERAALITFMKARPGTGREALARSWRENLGPSLLAVPAISGRAVRYVLNEIVEQPPAGYEYDAISELWFSSVAEAVAALADPGTQAVMHRQMEALDPARNVQMFTRITHTWTASKA